MCVCVVGGGGQLLILLLLTITKTGKISVKLAQLRIAVAIWKSDVNILVEGGLGVVIVGVVFLKIASLQNSNNKSSITVDKSRDKIC